MFTNSPSTLTFCLLQNITCVDWTIYSWQGSNSLGCPLMLQTNYRCVQSLNISVDVAKFVENVHKFTQFTHFLSVTKKNDFLTWTIYSWQGFNSLGCPLMLRTNYRCVQSLKISVDVAKCGENVHTFIHYTHFCLLQKRTCPLNNLFMARFHSIGCPLMTYNKHLLFVPSIRGHPNELEPCHE